MKQNWIIGTLSAIALVTAWTQLGSAQAVSFSPPPGSAAPRSAAGGASRGSFFTPPPSSSAPRNATGGASRSGFFTPPPDSAAPRNATGGSSRGGFFSPPPGSAAPRNAAGGASRGEFFTPPPGNSAPNGTSSGGASRGEALFESFESTDETAMPNSAARGNVYGTTSSATGLAVSSMMAVMPNSFYGTTLKARPTILVYVPGSNADEAVFSLKDEAKNMVYQMSLPVPHSGGIIAVELPADAPELAVGENYQWYVAIKVDDELSPASPFVDGWIQRVAPSYELTATLGEGNELADIEQLGANGIWYDTVAQMASLKTTQTDDAIAHHWYELLESVGLAEIAAAPIAM
jgi:Domain of Unknown Function (DUF928)